MPQNSKLTVDLGDKAREYFIQLQDHYQTIVLQAKRDSTLNLISPMHEIDRISTEIHDLFVRYHINHPELPQENMERVLDYTRHFKVDMNDAHHQAIKGKKKEVLSLLSKYHVFIEKKKIEEKINFLSPREEICSIQYLPAKSNETKLIQ
ncbi:MAG: hypothetical protein ACP5N2_01475 [Candidatus Nanoarchaeia archaeon]